MSAPNIPGKRSSGSGRNTVCRNFLGGVMVTNTPDVLTETTADLAWALMMSAARRVIEADAYVRRGDFKCWHPSLLLGQNIHRKTLGIFGMGRIGTAAARRAAGFGMRV